MARYKWEGVRYWIRILEFGEADFFFTGMALLDLKFDQALITGMRLVESISSQIPCFGELFTDFTRNLKPNFKKNSTFSPEYHEFGFAVSW